MTDLIRFIRATTLEPLAIERRTLDAFVRMVRGHLLDGQQYDGARVHAELGIEATAGQRSGRRDRAVAVLPIVGTIANRGHSAGPGADRIGENLDAALNDSRVDAIVLDVDSPGGTVAGVPELAAKIFAARNEKPIVAVANGMMASAAYWIGAAATELVVTPSSEVGSIGVYLLHEDWTAQLEADGVKVTEIAAGKFKTEGAPWKQLDEAGREFLQARVAEVYAWFVRDVARFRGDTPSNVRGGYGEGRVLSAKPALEAKLVDRIATLEETVERMAGGGRLGRGSRGAAAASNELERQVRERQRKRSA